MADVPPPPLPPDAAGEELYGGHFLARRLLKEGQGIRTFLGEDRRDGAPVILKVADAHLSGAARLRLQHEAEVLRAARSPFLASLLEVGQQDNVLYLVMPCVPGVSLQERLRRGPLTVGETLTVSRCLLAALHEAHVHGVLHRDVKPANLMVPEAVPLDRATLIDFGLARSSQLDRSIRDLPAGTACYVAPEQAGLLHHEVDERSDLYAAGVVLFECLAGRPPFTGDRVGEVLRQHLTTPPPDLRGLVRPDGAVVPRTLDAIVRRLLGKDPGERYQSAEAVLADLDALAEALARGDTDPALVVGLHDRPLPARTSERALSEVRAGNALEKRQLAEPSFVGRARELSLLDGQLQGTRRGQGGLVLIEAQSGGGKTRLLNEFVDRCARQGAMILRGQGVDQAARHPFQVLDGVSDDLERVIAGEPETADRLRKDLGSWREALTDALPRLAEVLQIEPGHGAAPLSEVRPGSALEREAFGELRNLRALTALLDALGRQERPALVLLDDCQWADELTLKLLRHWQTRPGEGPGQGRPAGCGQHVCIVAAFRSEEVAGRHLLRIMEPSAHLSLSPLLEEDLRTLAESMAGPLPDEAVALVCRLAEGSPFMASAVLRGLVEAGALVPAPSGWQVEPRAMADVQSSRQAAALLARRLGLLAPEIVHLLGVGAVLGKEFDIAFALDLAGQAPQQALPALTEARRRHLVWADREGGRYTFAHDKLREAVLALLPAAERRDLHLRAALRLEEQSARGPSVFELAYHFDAAGACDRALPYALAAAEQARAQHALAIAEQQYRIAERGAHAAEPAVRRRVAEGLGDVLMLRGHYAEAERRFQTALDLADTKVGRAQVGGKLGELALKRGDVRTACVALEQALRLLGRQVPSTRPGLLIRLLWEGSVQALHTFFPRVFLARRPLAGADEEMLAVRLYTRLAYAYWFGRGAVPALWTHLRGMNLAERYPPTPELAHSYSEHAPAMTVLPFLSRGMVYAEKSLAMRRAFSDLWGQGQSLHFHGVVLYAASRFRECIDRCREAIRILERMGDQWEINTARWHIAFCLYRLGDLAGAVEEARRAYQAAVAIGDHQAAGISLGVWSKASGGRVPASLLRAALDGPLDDVHTAAEVLMADGVRLLHEDRPAEAVAQLEEAWRRVHDGGMRQEYVSPVLPWLATALRAELAATPAWAADRRRALLRRSRAVVRRGLRVARWYRNNLPHALREAGYLAAASGRSARARRCFEESLAVAEEQEARAEAALTLQARGEVGMSLGWPGADEDLAAARKELGPLEESLREVVGERPAERTPTLSQADRFDQVLDAGRRIASALTQETIFATVQEAVQVLLRGEHCLVVQFDDSGKQWTPVYGALPSGFSRATAERAVASGRPVLFEAGSSGDVGESMVLAGIRAALYAPFFVRGRAGGCFCVLHRQVGGLFGADEERLAAFIAAVAGAALENAEGFAQLQRLNETLEERVAERTATAEERAYQLARANAELQEVLASVKSLRGLLPICAACKMIRDDQGYWHQVELYIKAHSDADFSHGICPGCAQKLYPDYFPTAEDEADCSTR